MIGPATDALDQTLEHLRSSTGKQSDDLTRVAREFESLLVSQILKSARDSSSGGWLGGEGETGTMMVEVAEQQLARAIASQGGLGLADLVIEGLKPEP